LLPLLTPSFDSAFGLAQDKLFNKRPISFPIWQDNCSYFDMGKESTVLGKEGETIAVDHLIEKGYEILERNFRSQQGEIDIIAKENGFLVFVEVKMYSIGSYGTPLGAIRKPKKESIIHAARTYLLKNNIKDVNCRFDVLAIYRSWKGLSSFDLIKDAFHVG